MVRVERLRWWPEGIESQITIESPQPGRHAASLWASLRRARIFGYPERPAPDIPPRRSRFGISQPELQGIHVLHRAEIHADLSDNSKSYTKRTLSGRYWLPHPPKNERPRPGCRCRGIALVAVDRQQTRTHSSGGIELLLGVSWLRAKKPGVWVGDRLDDERFRVDLAC
jgi:hypothetical protein